MSQQENQQNPAAENSPAEVAEAEQTAEQMTPEASANGDGPALDSLATEDSSESEESAPEETLQETLARLESELAEAKAQAGEAIDRMQRTVAEYENAGKRRERQAQERIDRATENFVRQLLPVLDDFALAFENVPEEISQEEKSWVRGFEQIQQKLLTLLADAGVEPVEPDGAFDPNRHEAISHEPNDDVPSGHIIQTLRTGYQRQDRILRPALVRVAQ